MEENKKSEMVKKLLKFVCVISEKENETSVELEAMTEAAKIVVEYPLKID